MNPNKLFSQKNRTVTNLLRMLILDVLISNGGTWANDDEPLGLTEPAIFNVANLDNREYEKLSLHLTFTIIYER
jgi:hypothetical protein